ncbi:hypothetical protein AB0H34_05530 [Saccharopolyspora shandongensis]|uniref:hypothetical protein n=1 Tax=Saccharopolyspora shandongensis TaxID=418495 RepID=UPI0033CE073D
MDALTPHARPPLTQTIAPNVQAQIDAARTATPIELGVLGSVADEPFVPDDLTAAGSPAPLPPRGRAIYRSDGCEITETWSSVDGFSHSRSLLYNGCGTGEPVDGPVVTAGGQPESYKLWPNLYKDDPIRSMVPVQPKDLQKSNSTGAFIYVVMPDLELHALTPHARPPSFILGCIAAVCGCSRKSDAADDEVGAVRNEVTPSRRSARLRGVCRPECVPSVRRSSGRC